MAYALSDDIKIIDLGRSSKSVTTWTVSLTFATYGGVTGCWLLFLLLLVLVVPVQERLAPEIICIMC